MPALLGLSLGQFAETNTFGLAEFTSTGAEDARNTVLTTFRHHCSPVLASLLLDIECI
jgi:hypothetical protein